MKNFKEGAGEIRPCEKLQRMCRGGMVIKKKEKENFKKGAREVRLCEKL